MIMKKNLFCCIIVLSLLITGCSFSSKTDSSSNTKQTKTLPAKKDKTLTIAGSGSNLPITQKLIDGYAKKTGIKLKMAKSIGTEGAVKALQANQLDIGLISRPLIESEKQAGLIQKRYARIAIVLGVNSQVPDETITSEDLVKIYNGTKNTWKNGELIIVLSREEGDSSTKVLEDKIPYFKEAFNESIKIKRWAIHYSDIEEANAIANTNYSLGITNLSTALSLNIKPLNINGIPPTLDNIKNEKYPFYKDLYFAYNEPFSDQGKKFLDFVFSPEGQNIMSKNNCIPMIGDDTN